MRWPGLPGLAAVSHLTHETQSLSVARRESHGEGFSDQERKCYNTEIDNQGAGQVRARSQEENWELFVCLCCS